MIPSDLELVLSWRNQKRVCENMYSDRMIPLEEHQAWFATLDHDANKYLVLEVDNTPCGLSYFNRIDRTSKTAEWGFYLGESDIPKGAGTVMGFLSLEKGFGELELRKVYGEVLGFNQPSCRLFERLRFCQDGIKREEIVRNGEAVDVILFSMLRYEWLAGTKQQVLDSINDFELVTG
jgi:UDP-4-amino-4,6-dideoxy-N-acetyl-beta-L-altrosamine N-acetyltransferase